MYNFLQNFHSGWAYLTLLAAILFFFSVGFYAINKKQRNNALTKLSFITTIVFHVQLVLGLALYFYSPYAKWNSETMKDSTLRFFSMEHPLMMFAAVIFITIANSKLKKSESVQLSTAVFALLGLALVLSRIPWATWLA